MKFYFIKLHLTTWYYHTQQLRSDNFIEIKKSYF